MEWISVKDRLPEINTTVLIYLEGGHTDIGTRNKKWDSQVVWWYGDCEEDVNIQRITHWMPLPNKPEVKD